ncbi:sterol desaturase [Labrys miyagiensis]
MPAQIFSPDVRLTILATALGFMVLEYLLGRLASHDTHDLRESAASFAIAIGQNLVKSAEALVVALPFAFVHQHRLLDFIQTSPQALVALFLGSEFFYYWHHRAAHRIRWMWATHCVHHSTTKLNLTAAVRLGWTGNVSGNFLFFLPLAWIGFHPFAVLGMLALNLMYQFFIHTELPLRLGALEWILNTPTHHRVHHACNRSCLDRNYGGMLIVFDRLFGTFAAAPRDQPLRYGLAGVSPTLNPIGIAFGEWFAMFRDFSACTSWPERWRTLFAPPGAPRRLSRRRRDVAASLLEFPTHHPGE